MQVVEYERTPSCVKVKVKPLWYAPRTAFRRHGQQGTPRWIWLDTLAVVTDVGTLSKLNGAAELAEVEYMDTVNAVARGVEDASAQRFRQERGQVPERAPRKSGGAVWNPEGDS